MPQLPPTDTSSLLARLGDAQGFELRLLARRNLGRSLVCLELEGAPPDLAPAPGQDLMVAVPVEGGDGSFRRRYSIRHFNAAAARIELWIDTAAGGPGSRWAASAPIGSTIEAIGPRGKIGLDPMADWHLFIGDLSFLPAAFAMAESIEPPGQAIFLFELDGSDGALRPDVGEGIGLTLGIIERGGRPLGDATGLLSGLAALELPDDEGHAYVGGELRVVAALRAALEERGLASASIDAKPYWRRGVANLAHGEPRKDLD
jgi:NADPH-dependent ferric siderophore reductase